MNNLLSSSGPFVSADQYRWSTRYLKQNTCHALALTINQTLNKPHSTLRITFAIGDLIMERQQKSIQTIHEVCSYIDFFACCWIPIRSSYLFDCYNQFVFQVLIIVGDVADRFLAIRLLCCCLLVYNLTRSCYCLTCCGLVVYWFIQMQSVNTLLNTLYSLETCQQYLCLRND